MNKTVRRRTILGFLAASALLACGPAARATQSKAGQSKTGQAQQGHVTKDEFFIISSFDTQKHELVLKRPTEVTLRMSVTDKTSVLDEHGKTLRASDLRSGDTAFITYWQDKAGAQALRIHLGPMTVEELRRRYWKSYAAPAGPAAPRKTRAPRARPQAGKEKPGQEKR